MARQTSNMLHVSDPSIPAFGGTDGGAPPAAESEGSNPGYVFRETTEPGPVPNPVTAPLESETPAPATESIINPTGTIEQPKPAPAPAPASIHPAGTIERPKPAPAPTPASIHPTGTIERPKAAPAAASIPPTGTIERPKPAAPAKPPPHSAGLSVPPPLSSPPKEPPPREPSQPLDGRTRVLSEGEVAASAPAGRRTRGELYLRSGPAVGQRFTLYAGAAVVVGRSSQADCTIPDEAVSRKHFELRVTPTGVHLKDLGSGNGTVINGKRVSSAKLLAGDRIFVGDSVIEYRDREAKPSTRSEGANNPDRLVAVSEHKSWSLARIPDAQRRLMITFMLVALFIIIVISIAGIVRNKQRAEQQLAIQERQAGRHELTLNPPNPLAALEDFQHAIHAYPDPEVVKDDITQAQSMVAGLPRLARARELLGQRDLEGARRELASIPKTEYFIGVTRPLEEELTKLSAARRNEDAPASDPVIAAVQELMQKARKATASADTALSALSYEDQAYQLLQKRNIGGPLMETVKAEYAALLVSTAQTLRKRNPAKSAALESRAASLSVAAPTSETTPPPPPQIRPIARAETSAHLPKKKARRSSPPPKPKFAAASGPEEGSEPAPAPAPRKAAAKYDDDRADSLCDDGDSLLGQDPDAAKRKYAEALKLAHPGSAPASRAREGLNN